jgi:cytochrome c
MKKFMIAILGIGLLVACNSSGSKDEKKAETTAEEPKDLSANPDYQKGLALASSSDCFTCHKIDEVLTGPSYREIANKYKTYPDTIITHLAGKIISGGSGVFGQVFMTPHPGVSEADAEQMVKYILLLKN